MKKIFIILMSVMVLAWTAPATQAQKKKQQMSAKEANELLQKCMGNWQINMHIWQPEQNTFAETKGSASFNTCFKDNYLREVYTSMGLDNVPENGEGCLRYSEQHNRFEFVQMDDTGKSMLLMVGKYDPKNKLLTLTPINGHEQWGSSGNLKMLCQYYFLDDGTIKKIVRQPNEQGKYIITSISHYVRTVTGSTAGF